MSLSRNKTAPNTNRERRERDKQSTQNSLAERQSICVHNPIVRREIHLIVPLIRTLYPKLQTHPMRIIEWTHAVTHLILESGESIRYWFRSVRESVVDIYALFQIGVLVMRVHSWDEREESLTDTRVVLSV